MSLSRLAQPAGKCRVFVLPVQAIRSSSQSASDDSNPDYNLRPEEMDNPGFIQKIILRFKGIPLKGEVHAPRSMFQDVDKEWFAPKSLPEMPRDFKEFPERDLKNYPYPARRMYPPKTRMLMIPDSWMAPFQKVTGVTGPYLFFGGLFAFFVNKEIYVLEEQAHMLAGWILFYLLVSRTVGYRIDKWLYGEYQKRMDHYKELIEEDLKEAKSFRASSAAETASLTAAKQGFPEIFKENMAMQLEAAFRHNIQVVSKEMKRRVDFLQETESAKERFNRAHMLNWIANSVRSEITENKAGVKDQYLNNCIDQLRGLAAKA